MRSESPFGYTPQSEQQQPTAAAATATLITFSRPKQEKVELVAPPEGSAVGERLSFEGVAGGPFEPVSAAQMEKKKVLDKVLPVRQTPLIYTPQLRKVNMNSRRPSFAVCALLLPDI